MGNIHSNPGRLAAALALGMAAGFSAASAQYSGTMAREHRHVDWNTAGQTEYYYSVFFDDVPVLESPVWLRYKTFVNPLNSESVRYLDMKHYKSSSVGRCWEVEARSPSVPGTDWIIFANTGTASAPIWVKAADDVNGLMPRARVWVKGSVPDDITRLRLSPYFASQNATSATLDVRDYGSPSEAECLSSGDPGIKIIATAVTVVNPR